MRDHLERENERLPKVLATTERVLVERGMTVAISHEHASNMTSITHLSREQAAALRDALTEYLGDKTEPDPKGLAAARRYCGWHLGYTSWGDSIVGAYLNPVKANENLNREME